MSDTETPTRPVQLDAVVERYVALRDKKAALKTKHEAEMAPYTEAMDRLELAILKNLQAQGVESVRTKAGTAYTSRSVSVTVADKAAFRDFVTNNEAWDMVDMRAAKKAIEEYRDANDDIPPGINWKEATTVGVRRA
jgi:nanoRNase/pAp phosphatase (c-di-AMP/oligoRNAs hydrolase)